MSGTSVSITGAASSISAGVLSDTVRAALAGTASSSAAGSVLVTTGAGSVSITGASATSAAGALSEIVRAALAGASAASAAGMVLVTPGPTLIVFITGAAATSAAGAVSVVSPTPPPTPTPTPTPSATGSQANIVKRLASLIPPSWFSQASPTGHWWVGSTDIGALLQGFGNVASYIYNLTVLAKVQMRLLTSVGMFIDLWSYDRLGSYIQRKTGETDVVWKTRVAKEVVRIRVSRSGMYQAILDLTGNPPVIIEPWNTGDCGAWSTGVGSSALPTPSSWVTNT